MYTDVCVLGAGITGLSAAINVQKLIRCVNVTIIADSFGQDTTTPVTRNLFLPIPSSVKGTDPDALRKWFLDGWTHHFTRAKTPEGEESGHSLITGYYLWSEGEAPILSDAVFNFHQLSESELAEEDFPYDKGCRFTTVAVDFKKYFRWLMKEFRQRGGCVLHDTVYSLQELYGKYDIVINCTGMRAREQMSDPRLVPVKGHMVRVKTEPTKNFLVTDDNISVVPSNSSEDCECVDVGYHWKRSEHRPGVMREPTALVLRKARGLIPFLEDCRVVQAWAEKRPSEEPPLVKIEMLNCGSAILPVVHSIGLGTETLTLAWGTGVYVAHLVLDLQRTIKPFAHLMLPFKTLI
ncbi:D-aspartate oxidase [Aplysia californica]|uniref:D-aspartate oxidase n=1 Tax=Aplysia californica TaxID=6500 RepID=A0ABM0JK02_APLCA|nr:D-aspartate oxidase [Aplysia californica]